MNVNKVSRFFPLDFFIYLENDLLDAKFQFLLGIHDRIRGIKQDLFNIGKSFNLSLKKKTFIHELF